jgi:ketosteroid isomerase-like protein
LTETREAVAQTYTDYFQAFQNLDPEAVLPYYHLPCLFLSSHGVLLVTSAAEGRGLFAELMKGLKARSYARSGWGKLGVKRLSDHAALLSTRVVRYKTDGTELEQFGATYTFRKTDAGWKIAVVVVHDFDTVLELT